MLSPEHDDSSLADSNSFTYHATDASGMRCPIGAHVRRSNPRDSLDPQPGSQASIAVGKRHRILRRGREYGPAVTAEARTGGVDDGTRPRPPLRLSVRKSRPAVRVHPAHLDQQPEVLGFLQRSGSPGGRPSSRGRLLHHTRPAHPDPPDVAARRSSPCGVGPTSFSLDSGRCATSPALGLEAPEGALRTTDQRPPRPPDRPGEPDRPVGSPRFRPTPAPAPGRDAAAADRRPAATPAASDRRGTDPSRRRGGRGVDHRQHVDFHPAGLHRPAGGVAGRQHQDVRRGAGHLRGE